MSDDKRTNIIRTNPETFRQERLMESCEDDAELAAEVVDDFLASSPLILARLGAAIAAADAIGTRLEAHSIKGSAQTVGAERLAAAGMRLEGDAREGLLADAPALAAAIASEFDRLRPALETFLRAA